MLIDELGRPVRYLPRFEWEEILETKDFDFAASRDRTIEIQELKDGAWGPRHLPQWPEVPDDDRGFNFLTMLVDAADESCCEAPSCAVCRKPDRFACRRFVTLKLASHQRLRAWSAIWVAPQWEDWTSLEGRWFRFRVLPFRPSPNPDPGRAICSAPFGWPNPNPLVPMASCNPSPAEGPRGR